MKNVIYIFGIALLLLAVGCNDDDSLPVVTPQATGTLTDDDGNTYGWVRYNGLDWMTSNFKEGTPYYDLHVVDEYWGDITYIVRVDNMEQALADYDAYGNLYSWEEAVARAPEGWRLPTDEDWKSLEMALGMSESDANAKGWRGDGEGVLIQQDETGSGIHLTLSGCVRMSAGSYNDVMLRDLRERGYYWSSTVDSTYTTTPAVWYRAIYAHGTQIERAVTTTTEASSNLEERSNRYLSVRYVRDAAD